MEESVVLSILINQENLPVLNPTCKIVKKSNAHTELELNGMIPPAGQSLASRIIPGSDIIVLREGEETALLDGIIIDAQIKIEGSGVETLVEVSITARSYSWLLDRKKKERAFQNSNESYQSVAETVLAPYSDSKVILTESITGKKLEHLLVQYYETDWQFLTRLASWQNQPLSVNNKSAGVKIYLGALFSSRRYVIQENEEDEIEQILLSARKEHAGLYAFRFSTERTDMEALEVGDRIGYKGIDFFVKEAEITIENHEIWHRYLFCPKEEFFVPLMQNTYITGLSLAGSVKKVLGSQVQVDLDIDAAVGNDRWYAYATFYSMFYCMPEIGDRVFLYFPEAYEDSAFVLNSVRSSKQGGDNTKKETAGRNGIANTATNENSTPALANEGQKEMQIVDLTPYIDALASPEGGELIDLSVSYSDGTKFSLSDLAEAAKKGSSAANIVEKQECRIETIDTKNFEFENLMRNENAKVLSTPDGKMIVLDDASGHVGIFQSESTYIILKGSSIIVHTGGNITLEAEGDIRLDAKKSVNIKATEELKFTCMDSAMDILQEEIKISGNDIKIN